MALLAAYAVPHPPLIVPAVGCGEEAGISTTIESYREVAKRIARHNPDAIVLTSPHAPLFRDGFFIAGGDAFHGSMVRFRAPSCAFVAPYDAELASAIALKARAHGIPVARSDRFDDADDHASFVPLWFVREAMGEALPPIVRIGLSGLSGEEHRELGRVVADTAAQLGRRVVFIASGDLSHKLKDDGSYGFAAEGPVFDERVTTDFANGDLDDLFWMNEAFTDAAAECGLRSFQIMTGALEDVPHTSELLSYEGPFGVGYGVAAFEAIGAGAETASGSLADRDRAFRIDPDPYVALARASVEGFVRTGKPIAIPDDLPDDLLKRRAGAFVSLHEHGELRGCIGTIEPCGASLAEEIVSNAVSACSRDPRFDPVRPDELDDLSYSVDVLFPPEDIASPDELDPARYGVIVTNGRRRGLLLPNLEGVDSIAQQIAIARRKAGIAPGEPVRLERFEVVRHERGGEARRARRA